MCIEFRKISDFNRGILYQLLVDAYSFDNRCKQCWDRDWKEFDDFFYDNLEIADKYGFVTTLNDEPIGHISWDPRNRPEYVQIGHNCIATKYKGKGYGKRQLSEAVRRIRQYDSLKKIIVNTNALMISAQRNYESAGFELVQRRENHGLASFLGDFMDYEIKQSDKEEKNSVNYGTLSMAQEYAKNEQIEEWVQLFLRSDGKNIALADGLLLEKREYLGPIKIKISFLKDIEEGAPEYLTQKNDKEYFFWVVENMKGSLESWDVPPLIVEFRDNQFYVNDGRHRLEMFRQLGVEEIDVVLWTTGEEDKNKVLEIIG